MKNKLLTLALGVALLAGCGGSDDDDEKMITFNFNKSSNGWSAGFADYPLNEEDFYELSSGRQAVPAPLSRYQGYRLSGNNHSDDLFMFIKKKFSGLKPNTRYELEFEVTLATNAPRGCIGVGGAPGESVFVKAGASAEEPKPVISGDAIYRMNIHIGSQGSSGSDAVVLGDMANSQPCDNAEGVFELKTLTSETTPFSAYTNEAGELWLLFGTDSGYESVTTVYFVQGTVSARQ